MPSGFQNDANQLQAEMYRVTITMSNTTYYPTADSTDNGGVTPNSWDAFASPPSSLAKGQARARGNMRFRNIVNRLTGLGDCQIRDITMDSAASGNTEATADTQSTRIDFTVAYDRPAMIALTGTLQGATALGNDVNSAAMDTTAKRIANEIALGIQATTTANMRVYNTSVSGGQQLPISVTATGMTAIQTLSTVAVTLIDESTLFN